MRLRDWFSKKPKDPFAITDDEWTPAAREAEAKLPQGCSLKVMVIGSRRMVDVTTLSVATDLKGQPVESSLSCAFEPTLERAVIRAVEDGIEVWNRHIEYREQKRLESEDQL